MAAKFNKWGFFMPFLNKTYPPSGQPEGDWVRFTTAPTAETERKIFYKSLLIKGLWQILRMSRQNHIFNMEIPFLTDTPFVPNRDVDKKSLP